MAKKATLPGPGSALLPVVGEPGTFEWCEEVVECMNAAWRAKETAEQGFLAAVRAAIQYRIWEMLSPPPPKEPYHSLEALIRATADAGEAENMQIAIRFSGVLNDEPAPGDSAEGRAVAASGPSPAQLSVPAPRDAAPPPWSDQPLSEEEEIALGNALLDQYAAQPESFAVGVPAAEEPPVPPKRTAAQRKRDRLERTRPELAEAVQSGEITLKQAYVEAGIERPVRTIDKLQRLWKSASEEERERFRSWLEEQARQERRREYEQEVYGEEA